MRAHAIIAIVATLPLLALSFVAGPDASNYRYSFAFLIPILWGVYAARRWLHLHPLHFALFAIALILHDLGAFGCYRKEYAGLAFDTYVHFYFGLAGALLLERAFREGMRLPPWQVWIATILFILGMGAIHEMVEAASTYALGPNMGMFKADNIDKYDTQKDLFNNLFGAVVALSLAAVTTRVLARRGA